MSTDDEQLILVFNGEIFNYIELRGELETLGHNFKSRGDTEVLLHAYREWGAECLTRLNGMWAFVIYDLRRGCLFGSRDRFGEKPLYFYKAKDCILFASEIKAILSSGVYRTAPNWKVASEFLVNSRLDTNAESFYQGIEQVSPGTAFEINLKGELKTWRYWSLPQVSAEEVEDSPRQFAELFEDSVRLRMRSDVPVGVCLSGGLDSTAIICAMARHWNGSEQPLHAFAYHAAEFDESSYIADTIRMTEAHLNRLQTDSIQAWSSLNRVLAVHDEPVHAMSAIVGFELMGLAASNGVKVVLNGQGADETLAGYSSFFRDYWYTLLRSGEIGDMWNEIKRYTSCHGDNEVMLFLKVVRHLLLVALSHRDIFRRLSNWKNHLDTRRNDWFTMELFQHVDKNSSQNHDWTLDAMLKQSVERAPLPLYLRVEDRNSMAHSVEARLPFLDYRLVSLVFKIAAKWKMRGPLNKYILREAMRERIPESVRNRVDKMGFPVPQAKWMFGALQTQVQDILGSREMRERGIYNLIDIRRDIELHRQGRIDVSGKLFRIVQFELWSKLQKNRLGTAQV